MTRFQMKFPALAAALFASGFAMAAQEQSLGAVVVTASGFEQAVEDAPASITVVTREELEKKSYKDITDALRDVPGVVVTGGGSSSDISIRGMAAGYTMLLVDGRRQNSRETRPNSDGSGIEQGWLPPVSAIERIEVVRGPMSSLYGSDAMGGVINIITRKVAKTWSGSVRAETTQQEEAAAGDMYQAGFYLSGPIKDDVMGLQLYGNKSRRIEDKFVGGFNEQDTLSGTAKLSLTPNKDHDIVLEVGRTMQDRISTPGKSAALESCRRGRCTPNSVSENNYDKTLYALSHTGRFALGTTNTYVQQESIDNPGRQMYLKNTEFNSQITMPLGKHLTTLGVSYKNEDLVDNSNKLGQIERYQWALFAENEWSISDAFALTTGLRMNEDENYGTHWTPRVYGVWKATEQLSLKGGISSGFKAPGLRSAAGQVTGGGGDPAWIIGNPDLKPEKSLSQELGVVWDNRSNLSTSFMLFNTEFKDKITEIRSCSDTASAGQSIQTGNCVYNGKNYKFLSDRVNVDKANMRGIEATATWSVSDAVRLATNYTYTHSEQKSGQFKGQPLSKMPRHMLNATLDWRATADLGLWSRMNFRSKTSDYLSRTSMAKGTPSFTFVDVGLNYQVAKNTKLGAGIYNLFDKQVDDSTYGAQYDGRRYWVSVTAGF
ncbi:ligand-gated channel protein [Comamonas sp. NoAH]|uniref:ligand-gated channel protein n=1 Tax=Comamonas halotolerans TaxID=3041496 RepID=UPI0024E06CCB|nr:ligand-gated channel protein [Comamonas sp. NoAH]